MHTFINIKIYACESESHSVMSDSLQPHGLYRPWNSPGQNTGVFCSLLQGSSQPKDQTQVSYIAGRFFTSWATREAQEYWSGEPIPSPGDLPHPGIEPGSPAWQADSLPAELPRKPNICKEYLKIQIIISDVDTPWIIWEDSERLSVCYRVKEQIIAGKSFSFQVLH